MFLREPRSPKNHRKKTTVSGELKDFQLQEARTRRKHVHVRASCLSNHTLRNTRLIETGDSSLDQSIMSTSRNKKKATESINGLCGNPCCRKPGASNAVRSCVPGVVVSCTATSAVKRLIGRNTGTNGTAFLRSLHVRRLRLQCPAQVCQLLTKMALNTREPMHRMVHHCALNSLAQKRCVSLHPQKIKARGSL